MSQVLIAVGFSEDSVNVGQLFSIKSVNLKEIHNEATDVIESMQNTLLQDYQRKNIDGPLGRWFCLKKPKMFYFALAHPLYSERLVYQLLNVWLSGNGHAVRAPVRSSIPSPYNAGCVIKTHNICWSAHRFNRRSNRFR